MRKKNLHGISIMKFHLEKPLFIIPYLSAIFFVQLIDIIVPSCKIKLETVIGTEIFMQSIEERSESPSISGIRVLSVLGISRIILYSLLKGKQLSSWRDFRSSQTQSIRNCGLYTYCGPPKSTPKQKLRFSFCVKTLTASGPDRIFWGQCLC